MATDIEKWHGTLNGYTNHRCRCSECLEAKRLNQIQYRSTRKERTNELRRSGYARNSENERSRARERRLSGIDDDDIRHGTNNGYSNYNCRCDQCKKANSVAPSNYKAKNLDKIRQYQREYYTKNSAAIRKKNFANRESLSLSRQEFRKNNPGNAYQATLRWRKKNPQAVLSYNANRRALRRGQQDEYVDRNIVWERDDGICHICKLSADPFGWHLDHIIPLSRGGRHSYKNTAVSHASCNLSKYNKILGGE